MLAALEAFIQVLKDNEIAVSPAEAIDAHRAIAEVGFDDRTLLRDALCATLAKSAAEADRFDTCFDAFFRREALSTAGESESEGEGGEAGAQAGDLERLVLEGDGADLAQVLEAAAGEAGAGRIQLATQRGLTTRRILDAMGLRALEERINALRESGDAGDAALADRLAARRGDLFDRAGAFVDRELSLRAGENARRLRERVLASQALSAVDPEDFRAMEVLVKRMAKRLASRHTRRRRVARRGRLDVRRTLRRAMGHDAIPFDLVWRTEKIEKPRIAVLCDVSRSVAAAAQFLLLFLYGLGEVVEKLDAFAFSDRLVSVDDLLAEETVDDAIALILARIGFRPTDYGRAFEDFRAAAGARIDRRTTVIILGDGRSNYAEPRIDILAEIRSRARAVVWLNPEPATYWGQGDSRMDAYARFCHLARPCNTLAGLERLIDDVLRTYLPR